VPRVPARLLRAHNPGVTGAPSHEASYGYDFGGYIAAINVCLGGASEPDPEAWEVVTQHSPYEVIFYGSTLDAECDSSDWRLRCQ
jgi:hypothetical protein